MEQRISSDPEAIEHTIPLPLVQDDESAWTSIVERMHRLGAKRVALYAAMQPNPANSLRHYRHRLGSAAEQDPVQLGIAPDLRFYDLWSELLAQRREQFAAAGIRVAFWMGQTLGHPGGFNGASRGSRPPFQHEMDADGKEIDCCLCPLCPRLREYLCGALARISRAEPEFILLDDDFRHTRHNPDWCLCPLHLAAFRARGLPDLPRRELMRLALGGAPGRERAAWCAVHEEAHLDLGRALGEAVRAQAPQVRLGLCSTQSCWDDLELPRLLTALAGPLRPLLRTHGAPYWVGPPHELGGIIEQVRWQRSQLRRALPAAEELHEGDTFPHLATRCPVTTFDAWHQALTAAGARGFLSYACSYVSPAHFESGYVDALQAQGPRYAAIAALAPVGAADLGVAVPWKPLATRRLSNPLDCSRPSTGHRCPAPLRTLARLGIPVGDVDGDGPVLLCGREAADASDAELAAWRRRGLVLDAPAAAVLLRRGIVCGAASVALARAPNVERFATDPLNGPYGGGVVAMWSSAVERYYRLEPLPGAEALSVFHDAADAPWGPAVLRWSDAAGARLAVLGWDFCLGGDEYQLHWSHARRHQLARLLGWVSGAPLPCTVDAPNLQVLVRRRADGATIVGALNCGLDPVAPVLRVHPALAAASRLRLLPPTGDASVPLAPEWRSDGEVRLLALPCRLPAHGFCLVEFSA